MKSYALAGYLKMGHVCTRVEGLTEYSQPKTKVKRKMVHVVAQPTPIDRVVGAAEFNRITKLNLKAV